MDQLRLSDHRRLLDSVRECYAIRDFEPFDNFLGKLVTTLSRLIPSTIVTYNDMHPDKPESYNVGTTAEVATAKAGSRWQQHMHEQPVLVHIRRTGDAQAIRISDFWSQRQLHSSGLYSGFYRYYDMEDSLCINILSRFPRIIGIAWHRDCCFTNRERMTAELIRPHVFQALQNAERMNHMHDQLQLLKRGLEDAALAVIACDADGRVQLITALARQYLVAYLGASQGLDRRLPEELLRWVRYQSTQLMKRDTPPVRLPLTLQKGDARLTVRMLSNAGANLLLLEEKTPAPDAAALDGFCLSRRESEVLAWVAQGKTNSELAMILGMSLPTAKKHMEHILQKLGVETRTAAAAMALQSFSHNN